MITRWGVKWNDVIMWDNGLPLFFCRKEEAEKFIDERYRYIRARKDLQRPPCNWRMPKAVKIHVILEEFGK